MPTCPMSIIHMKDLYDFYDNCMRVSEIIVQCTLVLVLPTADVSAPEHNDRRTAEGGWEAREDQGEASTQAGRPQAGARLHRTRV